MSLLLASVLLKLGTWGQQPDQRNGAAKRQLSFSDLHLEISLQKVKDTLFLKTILIVVFNILIEFCG